MCRVRSILLSLVAVMLVGAVAALAASAAIEFKWKVGGAELKSGESKEFTVNNDSKKFDAHLEVFGGVESLLLSTSVKVEPGAKIIGGVPGTNEETVVFSGVTADLPANCAILQNGVAGTVKTTPIKTEIVEGAIAGVGNSEVDILFTPKTGTTFATFEYTGASCGLNGVVAPVTGSVLALALPQKTEVLRQNLVFEANTKEYHNRAGTFAKAKLELAREPATITGLVLVILNSDQVFGPF